MNTYNLHTLPNGIRIVHMPDSSQVGYCGVAMNIGTRDELEEEQGYAHLLEHMLFKGTAKRNALQIINRAEDVGSDLNAYTTKEEIFVYAAFLVENFERLFELIADIVFHSTFPKKELETEIDVIFDEINSYKDNPAELIFDDFEELVFEGYPIGKNILGSKKSLRKATSRKLMNFIHRVYDPANIVFFSLGNIPFKKVVKSAEKYLSDIAIKQSDFRRVCPEMYVPKTIYKKKKTYQAHCTVGNRAYNLFEPKRQAAFLLNNMLGGPCMSSRLNLSLREKNGLAYNVESNYTPYSDTGIWNVYFGTDVENVSECMDLLYKELTYFRTTTVSENQLKRAKKQLLAQLSFSSENKENVALNMAKSILYYNQFEDLKSTALKIDAISSEQIRQAAEELFDEARITTLIYTN